MGKGKPHRHFDNEFKRNAKSLMILTFIRMCYINGGGNSWTKAARHL
jgi:hypothetical protein